MSIPDATILGWFWFGTVTGVWVAFLGLLAKRLVLAYLRTDHAADARARVADALWKSRRAAALRSMW